MDTIRNATSPRRLACAVAAAGLFAGGASAQACVGFLGNLSPCTIVVPGTCTFTAGQGQAFDIVSAGPYVAVITSHGRTRTIRHADNQPRRERSAIQPGDRARISLVGTGMVTAETWGSQSGS